jgi:hypothetical protein
MVFITYPLCWDRVKTNLSDQSRTFTDRGASPVFSSPHPDLPPPVADNYRPIRPFYGPCLRWGSRKTTITTAGSSRCMPRQRTVVPGSPSLFRPRKPLPTPWAYVWVIVSTGGEGKDCDPEPPTPGVVKKLMSLPQPAKWVPAFLPESRSGGGLSRLFPMEKLSEDAGNR